ncbi:exodeoxyribonuclease VII small subunit [Parvularcula sp. LCG005]|uniref:exodeoxyribonuclease VII small subunit n=1 Tax=Parvularcula sp. LCG005 TaxID=3078805 RepID=UPI002942BE74|nr:exodeoxyribonuclease VII small subunit [Parvularcula sp. LCG005]WOI54641.1 exodeoxyribonuclease VII small subunit [Parvularcula sp. LCG005]
MNDISTLSFEAALAELEQIISKLEAGDVELEKSIALYERGAALKKHCETTLKSAREKIEKIVLDADGKPQAEAASFD